MTHAHEVPDAIQWHEGMLLAPQHFQLLSERVEAITHFHQMNAMPYRWGIIHLETDETVIANGVFRVLSLEAIMPDGLAVSHHLLSSQPLEIKLADHLGELSLRPQFIYLAVPRRRSGNVMESQDLKRYESYEGDLVSDDNTGEGAIRIPRLRPRLKLVLGKPSKQYASFPLAKVVCRSNTLCQEKFSPPSLAVDDGHEIGKLCRDMIVQVRRKAFQFSGKMSSSESAGGSAALIQTRQTIQALVAGLPQLEAVLACQKAHPFTVYLAVVNLLGHMAVLGKSHVPPLLAPYDHDNALAAFEEARNGMFDILDEKVISAYNEIPFHKDGTVFHLHIEKHMLAGALYLGVAKGTNVSEEEVHGWLEGAVIGPRSRLQSMRDVRILGLDRERVQQGSGVVADSDMVVYRLETDSSWIIAGEDLVILPANTLTDYFTPSKVVLFIKSN